MISPYYEYNESTTLLSKPVVPRFSSSTDALEQSGLGIAGIMVK
jgi:hypothetical protein